MTAPLSPVLTTGLTDEQTAIIDRLLDKLASHVPANFAARTYYEAAQTVEHMGIAIPPEVANRIKPVIGWGGTVVDVIEERLDWSGWSVTGDDDLGLREVYDANQLAVEGGFAHLDSLMLGTAFVRVGTGGPGEPDVLVTPHSAETTTGTWNARARRLDEALTVTKVKDGQPVDIVLDVPGTTLTLTRATRGWAVVDRDDHRLPVPVVPMPNRPRGSRRTGRSEITRGVRYYCDAVVRTLLGMEGNREFYSIPQLVLLNRGLDVFVDRSGNPTSPWKVLAGHMIGMPKDDDDQAAEIEQLQVGSPEPFIAQVQEWAQLLAAEVGIPTSYLGFHTDNPASADAIRAGEARLVKRVERRQTAFGLAWMDVGRLALLMRDGATPADYWTRVDTRWQPASTPTKAATADAGMKQLTAVPWLAETDVGLELLGLSDQQIKRALSQRRRTDGRALVAGLAASEDAGAVKAKADALGVLIRAGVDPKVAAAQVGLDVQFTGAVPVSLRLPEADAAKVEGK